MSSEPAVQPGQLSPDGLWRWDGSQWVAAAPGSSPLPPPRRTRPWIWWLVGGCIVVLVLGAIGGGFGIYALVNRFQNGGFSCLPPDFPKYPGASVLRENAKIGGNLYPGDNANCKMVLQSSDGAEATYNFYRQSMSTGDWTIAVYLAPNESFQFRRKSRPQTTGAIYVTTQGQHTEIEIDYNS